MCSTLLPRIVLPVDKFPFGEMPKSLCHDLNPYEEVTVVILYSFSSKQFTKLCYFMLNYILVGPRSIAERGAEVAGTLGPWCVRGTKGSPAT